MQSLISNGPASDLRTLPMTFSSNPWQSPTKSGTWCIRIDLHGHSMLKSGRFARPGNGAVREDLSMSQLRIFSYLPNPRIWKATIAARLCGVEVEVRGSSPKELSSWLWDFDAHPLSADEQVALPEVRGQVGFKGTLHKTNAFMKAHSFGTVPAAFSPDGTGGRFEWNIILGSL